MILYPHWTRRHLALRIAAHVLLTLVGIVGAVFVVAYTTAWFAMALGAQW